ncbi:MAG: glycosyltransferase family 9 protein [Alphaproteobacteria bacterium]|nr:glycosyltransferase family 9 protein [Alphaproteobacteria bacterium]
MHILFVTATRIGDAVLSTGLLSHLIGRFPDARLTIAAGPVAAPLFEAVPGLERLIVVEKKRWALHWLPLYATVGGRRWDLVVDLRGSALAWLLRARERRVMAKGHPGEHRVRQLARLFELDPPPDPVIWTAPRHEAMAERLLPPGERFLVVAPFANWRAKEWPPERFAELSRRLTAADGPLAAARMAVLAAAHEQTKARPILDALPPERTIDLVGRVDLLTAAAIMRRAALFVGNDSGLMHMAATLGTPTLGLFGPSLVGGFYPWGRHAAIARTTQPRSEMFPPGFDHRTSDTLMLTLSVDAAEAAARGLCERVASLAA